MHRTQLRRARGFPAAAPTWDAESVSYPARAASTIMASAGSAVGFAESAHPAPRCSAHGCSALGARGAVSSVRVTVEEPLTRPSTSRCPWETTNLPTTRALRTSLSTRWRPFTMRAGRSSAIVSATPTGANTNRSSSAAHRTRVGSDHGALRHSPGRAGLLVGQLARVLDEETGTADELVGLFRRTRSLPSVRSSWSVASSSSGSSSTTRRSFKMTSRLASTSSSSGSSSSSSSSASPTARPPPRARPSGSRPLRRRPRRHLRHRFRRCRRHRRGGRHRRYRPGRPRRYQLPGRRPRGRRRRGRRRREPGPGIEIFGHILLLGRHVPPEHRRSREASIARRRNVSPQLSGVEWNCYEGG